MIAICIGMKTKFLFLYSVCLLLQFMRSVLVVYPILIKYHLIYTSKCTNLINYFHHVITLDDLFQCLIIIVESSFSNPFFFLQ